MLVLLILFFHGFGGFSVLQLLLLSFADVEGTF